MGCIGHYVNYYIYNYYSIIQEEHQVQRYGFSGWLTSVTHRL